MVDVMRLVMRAGGALHLRVYRASGGRLMGRTSGMPVLLLTVAGRTTGTPHTTPLVYLDSGGRYVVTGLAAGSPVEPQWFRNLRKADRAVVEVGRQRTPVTVEIAPPQERQHAVGAAGGAVTRLRPLPGQGGAGDPDGDPHPRPRRERPAGLSLVTSRVGPYGGLTGRPRWVGPAMHELAVTQSVVDAVMERTGEQRVLEVRLRVGRLSGVLPDALRFCFDLVTDGTPLQGAVLDIEEPPGSASVPAVRHDVRPDRPHPAVPVRQRGRRGDERQGPRHRFGRGGGGVNDVHHVRLR